MFAQLGTTVFDGVKTFESMSTSEKAVLAEFGLIGRKPKLAGVSPDLIHLKLSIFLHVEFTEGAVTDEIGKLQTSMESFEVLPLLWGNGESGGNWVISEMDVEYTNLDAQGNVYEARVDLELIESVPDNTQAQQTAANNAFAAGDKQPATKSKRKNPPSCQSSIAALVNEIRQFGAVVDNVIKVYTGDQTQMNVVQKACKSIVEDADQIYLATNTSTSCVYKNFDLGAKASMVSAQARQLSTDTYYNALSIGGFDTTGHTVVSGTTINSENNTLQSYIKDLLKVAQPITSKAIIQ